MVVFTFSVLALYLQVSMKKSVGISMLLSQMINLPETYSPRDLKPVAVLVLPYKAVLQAFFLLC